MTRVPLREDTRGLASGIIGFVAILIMAAMVFIIFDDAATILFDTASSQTNNAEAQSVIDTREQIWNNIMFFVLFVAFLYITARAVFETRTGGV